MPRAFYADAQAIRIELKKHKYLTRADAAACECGWVEETPKEGQAAYYDRWVEHFISELQGPALR